MTMTAENEQPDAEAYVMKRLRDDAWRLARQRHMEFMRQGCSYLLAHFLPPKTETFVLPGVPERSFVNPETKERVTEPGTSWRGAIGIFPRWHYRAGATPLPKFEWTGKNVYASNADTPESA